VVVVEDSVVRREEREVLRVVRRVDWVVVGSLSLFLVCKADDEVEDELAIEDECVSCGEVCVAMSLWKSSVGSESMVSTSELLSSPWRSRSRSFRRTLLDMAGMWLTFPSSFLFNFSRLWMAVFARSSREEVREWSMGWMRCLLAP